MFGLGLSSCNHREEKLELEIDFKKLSNEFPKKEYIGIDSSGYYFEIVIRIINNSHQKISIPIPECYWQKYFISNDSCLEIIPKLSCAHEYLNHIDLNPGELYTYNNLARVSRYYFNSNLKLKIGLIYLDYKTDNIFLLDDFEKAIENVHIKKDTIWSNVLNISKN